jgi:hypothetical protein
MRLHVPVLPSVPRLKLPQLRQAKSRPRLTRAAKQNDPKGNLKPQERVGIGICLALLVDHTIRYSHLQHQHDLQSHYTKPPEARTPPDMPPIQLK